MKIKSPVVIDLSHWEPVADYAVISPRPAMLIAKATEGYMYRDEWFLRHMAGASKIGALRGMYHFHRKDISAAAQVKNFCDTVRPIITKRDVIVLDVEEGGETAAQLIAWYEGVMAQYPDNPYWIYSRKNLLDPIAMVLGIFSQTAMEQRIERNNPLNAIQMTLAERTFFKTKLQATWTAGYPANPDLYDSVPSFYIPDQTKFPPVKVWQYTDKGRVAGIDGDVDLNWIDPTYFASLGGAVEPPNQDVVTEPFKGVRRITGVRYGRNFSLVIGDPKLVRYEVRHVEGGDQRDAPSNVAKTTGASFVWNGGDWDKYVYPYLPKDLAISNGIVRVPRKTARPSLIFAKDNTPQIRHENVSGQWNVTSGVRYIVVDGKPPAYLDGTEVQYTDRTARSIEGLDRNGNVMRLTVDGENLVTTRLGVTLKEAALLMIEYGCVTAFDTGGGGDTCEVMNGRLMNVPEDVSNGVHVERRVPEFLVMYAKENNMAYGNAREKFGNVSVVRRSPSRYGTEIRRLSSYAVVSFAEKVATIPQGTADKTGEMWLKLDDGNYVNWKLFNSSGVLTEMFTILSEPTTDPAPTEGYTVTVTITDADGWYGEGSITVKPK